MVGALVVYNNEIIGEGFTNPYGGPHAEVNAINVVRDKRLLPKSTLYVTLEPCSHFGKTPPCSDLIIEHKIPEVVIGCVDNNPEVAGKGIEKLKASGCTVIVGVLEKECKQHHKRFFTFHNKKRPYIILKWAETRDGFIAPKTKGEKKPVWITNTFSRQLVHKWRAEEQAILVGTNTVLEDNPSLTVRDWVGQNATRVILDEKLKIDKTYNVTNDDANKIIFHGDNDVIPKIDEKTLDWSIHQPLSNRISGSYIKIEWHNRNEIAKQVCKVLYNFNINSVIIEGGAKTLQSFIDEALWDEARVFIGDVDFTDGVKAPRLKGKLVSHSKLLGDTLNIYAND